MNTKRTSIPSGRPSHGPSMGVRRYWGHALAGAVALLFGGIMAGPLSCGSETNQPETARVTRSAIGTLNVLTRSYGSDRDGANLLEGTLNSANVNPSHFGRLFQMFVDDQVYAQVLYASRVATQNLSGTPTFHNIAYVATVNNSIYAFDADSGNLLWAQNYNFGARPPHADEVARGRACGRGNYHDFNATFGTQQFANIGIVGTPVIDPDTGILYFVVRTLENGHVIYRLLGVDITSGTIVRGPQTMPPTGLAGFNADFENQRSGLVLDSGAVYVAFASYCDASPAGDVYHGWVLGYDASTLQPTGAFDSTPNGGQAGIWQAGNAPAVDANGILYIATGNGSFDESVGNLGESVVTLSPRALVAAQHFTPNNPPNDYHTLDSADLDLGSAGPVLFHPSASSTYVVQGSKSGTIYVLDPGSLGGAIQGDTQIRQEFTAVAPGINVVPPPGGDGGTYHIHNGVVLWNSASGSNLYVWGENDNLRAYRWNPAIQKFNTEAFAVGPVFPPPGMPGGMLALSANGSETGSGILWATAPDQGNANHCTVPGNLYAFNADNLDLLWSSNWDPGDDIGELAKFNPPTVIDGKVLVASFSGFVSVFGPRSGPSPPVANGIYQIRTGVASNSCVDVRRAYTRDGTQVQEWTCNGTNAQRWQFTNVDNDVYEIRTLVSGKCLDVSQGSTADDARVQEWTCNSSSAQRWAAQAMGSGLYRLHPQTGPDECLDVSGSGANDGTLVRQFRCDDTTAQLFVLAFDNDTTAPIPDGTYRVMTTTGPAMCVDVATQMAVPFDKQGGASGDNVQQWTCDGSSAERWRFRGLGGGAYEVRAAVSDLCLDVAGGSAGNGVNVQQWVCNASAEQRWSVVSLGTGAYEILAGTSPNECLDVSNSGATAGTNIQQWVCNSDSNSQAFRVIAP